MIPSRVEKGILTVEFFFTSINYLLVAALLGLLMISGLGYRLLPGLDLRSAHISAVLLGWITLTIMGAMYQIVPVLSGKNLWSATLARWQFYAVNLGVLGFFFNELLVGPKAFALLFSGIVTLSAYAFWYIINRTIVSSEVKSKPLTLRAFQASTSLFLVYATLDFAQQLKPDLLANMALYYTARTHLFTLGWLTLTIFGAMYQMLPMLALRELKDPALAKAQLVIFILGAVGFITALAASNQGAIKIFAALALAGVYLFAYIMWRTLRGADWGKLDISVKFFSVAIAMLVLGASMGAVMAILVQMGVASTTSLISNLGVSAVDIVWAHVHIAMLGWATLTIMGAMNHLVPMLVWMERYGEKLGVEQVPTIKDMLDQRLAHSILWMAGLGIFGLLSGLYSMRLAGVFGFLAAVSFFAFAYSMYKIIR